MLACPACVWTVAWGSGSYSRVHSDSGHRISSFAKGATIGRLHRVDAVGHGRSTERIGRSWGNDSCGVLTVASFFVVPFLVGRIERVCRIEDRQQSPEVLPVLSPSTRKHYSSSSAPPFTLKSEPHISCLEVSVRSLGTWPFTAAVQPSTDAGTAAHTGSMPASHTLLDVSLDLRSTVDVQSAA